MDAFTTIFTTIVYLSSSPAQQPTSAAAEDLPQIDTVDYDRSTGSSGSSVIAPSWYDPAIQAHFTSSHFTTSVYHHNHRHAYPRQFRKPSGSRPALNTPAPDSI
ncbi:hypothetical protein B0H16DRAFT_1894074 [Mycena metata]|uniref:Uncharacterized protein n=1 Tax=Mycena metata TaxID=1033252 RepID=A0AAD7HVN4_9AGAR|nr:hypothetical protein B0H16DRAFT_1894074 [Mycena metata]